MLLDLGPHQVVAHLRGGAAERCLQAGKSACGDGHPPLQLEPLSVEGVSQLAGEEPE
jgi:hypothetical protein